MTPPQAMETHLLPRPLPDLIKEDRMDRMEMNTSRFADCPSTAPYLSPAVS